MKIERKKFKEGIIFYKLVQRTTAKIHYLKNLQFQDEMAIRDKKFRIKLELISFLYISKYINLRFQSIILNKDEGEQLKALEERIDKYQKLIFILDEILRYSESIEKDNLDEKTKSFAIEERNKFLFFGHKFSLEIKNILEEDKKEKNKLLKFKHFRSTLKP